MRKISILLCILILTACSTPQETIETSNPSSITKDANGVEYIPYVPLEKSSATLDTSECLYSESRSDGDDFCITLDQAESLPKEEETYYKIKRIIRELNSASKNHVPPLDETDVMDIITSADKIPENSWRPHLSEFSVNITHPSDNISKYEISQLSGVLAVINKVTFYVNLETGEITE